MDKVDTWEFFFNFIDRCNKYFTTLKCHLNNIVYYTNTSQILGNLLLEIIVNNIDAYSPLVNRSLREAQARGKDI